MLRELLRIFRSDNPIAHMGDNFGEMLELTRDMSFRAGKFFFDQPPTPDERTQIYKQDVQVNKLERRIRKQVIAHLAVRSNGGDVPYCLLLMSLVKDVERIGDYAKNLAEVFDIGGGPLPDDENEQELQEIRVHVEGTFNAVGEVFAKSDEEQALALITQGRDMNHRCDTMIARIAKGDYDAATTTSLVLGTRYYKRIGAHLLNVLSGVVMPLHKLDYYDEDELGDGIGD
ncbi:MAG: hypothetical protein OEY63_02005 [Gemmatimonadota bacterium]|nr:hypothetical protein [Gemmatimonadota bacterium]MDH5804505.1 hypothetical protein [Gemmatimonadota bacterium]